MSKQYTISREMYRKIKQMDSTEMGTFLSNVFKEGFETALVNANKLTNKITDNITIEDLYNTISKVKGIGDKRMIEIDKEIRKLFKERGILDEQ